MAELMRCLQPASHAMMALTLCGGGVQLHQNTAELAKLHEQYANIQNDNVALNRLVEKFLRTSETRGWRLQINNHQLRQLLVSTKGEKRSTETKLLDTRKVLSSYQRVCTFPGSETPMSAADMRELISLLVQLRSLVTPDASGPMTIAELRNLVITVGGHPHVIKQADLVSIFSEGVSKALAKSESAKTELAEVSQQDAQQALGKMDEDFSELSKNVLSIWDAFDGTKPLSTALDIKAKYFATKRDMQTASTRMKDAYAILVEMLQGLLAFVDKSNSEVKKAQEEKDEALRQTKAPCTQPHGDLEAIRKAHEAEIAKLTKTKDETAQKLNDVKAARDLAIKDAETARNSSESKQQQLQGNLKAAVKRRNEIESSLRQTESDSKTAQDEMQTLANKLESIEAAHSSEVQELRREHRQDAEQRDKTLTDTVNALKIAHGHELISLKNTHDQEMDRLGRAHQKELASAQEDHEEEKTRADMLEKRHADKLTEHLMAMKIARASFDKKEKAMSKKLEETETQLQEMTAEATERNWEMSSKNEEVRQLKEQLKTQHETANEDELTTKLDKLEKKQHETAGQLAKRDAELSSKDVEIQQLKAQLHQQEMATASAQEENKKKKQEKTDELSKRDEELNTKMAEISQLMGQLKQQETATASAQAESEIELMAKLEKARKSQEEMTSELVERGTQLDSKKTELQRLKDQLTHQDSATVSAREKNEKKIEELQKDLMKARQSRDECQETNATLQEELDEERMNNYQDGDEQLQADFIAAVEMNKALQERIAQHRCERSQPTHYCLCDFAFFTQGLDDDDEQEHYKTCDVFWEGGHRKTTQCWHCEKPFVKDQWFIGTHSHLCKDAKKKKLAMAMASNDASNKQEKGPLREANEHNPEGHLLHEALLADRPRTVLGPKLGSPPKSNLDAAAMDFTPTTFNPNASVFQPAPIKTALISETRIANSATTSSPTPNYGDKSETEANPPKLSTPAPTLMKNETSPNTSPKPTKVAASQANVSALTQAQNKPSTPTLSSLKMEGTEIATPPANTPTPTTPSTVASPTLNALQAPSSSPKAVRGRKPIVIHGWQHTDNWAASTNPTSQPTPQKTLPSIHSAQPAQPLGLDSISVGKPPPSPSKKTGTKNPRSTPYATPRGRHTPFAPPPISRSNPKTQKSNDLWNADPECAPAKVHKY